jgi:mono/diheme cytochrome c family protein
VTSGRVAVLILTVTAGAGLCLAQYGSQATYPTTTLPLYAGGMVQAQPPAAEAPAAEPPWVQRIEGKLDRLLKLVEDEAGADPKAKAGGGAGDALVSAAGKCAACHAPDVAKQAGGDFTFFQKDGDGLQMIPASTENEWRTLRRNLPKMPPADNKKGVAPLTPAERQAMDEWLNQNRPKK